MEKLVFKNVNKSFSIKTEKDKVSALKDVSFEINQGEFVSIIGPSGCGKSTILKLIAGLLQPTSGEITFNNNIIKEPNYLRGMVFQEPTLFPWLTVEENIEFSLKKRNVLKENKSYVEEVITMIGLEDFKRVYPHHLSGGMAQRVSIARTIVNKPHILLLDEPLGALDAFTRMGMQKEILKIWKKYNPTIVMVTHDVEEAIYMSDRVIVMKPRPGEIKEIINIDLKRERKIEDISFLEYKNKVLKSLNFIN